MQNKGGKYCIQSVTHPKELIRNLCNLIERQCMVDIAISCGNNTIHAHKCIMAANSPYFKENLEDKSVEQMLISGMEFAVMKAFVEFMYCGEMIVAEEYMKYFFAGLKLFKITALENVFNESDYRRIAAEEVIIPPPQFITKPAKYPSVYKPFNHCLIQKPNNNNNYPLTNSYNQHKVKRKCLITDAEKACYKEAQASKIAVANLRKSMNNQLHSFIVEESFNETTVENFIPTNDDIEFVAASNDLQTEPTNNDIIVATTNSPTVTTSAAVTTTASASTQNLTADKIKYILGSDEVEIMFQTSDGNFVNVSDEVLQDLSKGGLQYQVIDENGQIGEIQELETLGSDPVTNLNDETTINDETLELTKHTTDKLTDSDLSFVGDNIYENSLKVHNSDLFVEPENLSMNSVEICDKYKNDDNEFKSLLNGNNSHKNVSPEKKQLKFAPEMFFSDYSNDN